MAARTRIKIVRNDLRKEGRRMGAALERRLPTVTRQMRDGLSEAMASGSLPLQPDTGALAQSLAVQTANGSDFSERRQKAKDAYLNNPSLWREPVREHIAQSAYTEQHFENRAAVDEPPLTQDEHVARAAIVSMLAWGMLWEYGHFNMFTGKAEHRPWFVPFLETWWAQNADKAFSGATN